jgi:hypothetical protein
MGRAAAAIVAVALLALPSLANAQAPGQSQPPPGYAPPPPGYAPTVVAPPRERAGFLIGIGIGAGSIEVIGNNGENLDQFEGGSFSLQIGGLINPRFGLMLDTWSVVHEDDEDDGYGDDYTISHNITTIAAQYWLTPRFWIKGGIGRANYSVRSWLGELESEDGPALLGGLGYEVLHSRTFALDLQLRVGAGEYEEGTLQNGALLLGLNWY